MVSGGKSRERDGRMETVINQKLSKAVADLSKFPDVRKIYLIGSQAKGTATTTSDIDLLIVGPIGKSAPGPFPLGKGYHTRSKTMRGIPQIDMFYVSGDYEKEFTSPKWGGGKLLYDASSPRVEVKLR
jgi:hypothetical protein